MPDTEKLVKFIQGGGDVSTIPDDVWSSHGLDVELKKKVDTFRRGGGDMKTFSLPAPKTVQPTVQATTPQTDMPGRAPTTFDYRSLVDPKDAPNPFRDPRETPEKVDPDSYLGRTAAAMDVSAPFKRAVEEGSRPGASTGEQVAAGVSAYGDAVMQTLGLPLAPVLTAPGVHQTMEFVGNQAAKLARPTIRAINKPGVENVLRATPGIGHLAEFISPGEPLDPGYESLARTVGGVGLLLAGGAAGKAYKAGPGRPRVPYSRSVTGNPLPDVWGNTRLLPDPQNPGRLVQASSVPPSPINARKPGIDLRSGPSIALDPDPAANFNPPTQPPAVSKQVVTSDAAGTNVPLYPAAEAAKQRSFDVLAKLDKSAVDGRPEFQAGVSEPKPAGVLDVGEVRKQQVNTEGLSLDRKARAAREAQAVDDWNRARYESNKSFLNQSLSELDAVNKQHEALAQAEAVRKNAEAQYERLQNAERAAFETDLERRARVMGLENARKAAYDARVAEEFAREAMREESRRLSGEVDPADAAGPYSTKPPIRPRILTEPVDRPATQPMQQPKADIDVRTRSTESSFARQKRRGKSTGEVRLPGLDDLVEAGRSIKNFTGRLFSEDTPNPTYGPPGVGAARDVLQADPNVLKDPKTGQPQKLYHGTKANPFEQFNPELRGKNTGAKSAKRGEFFTDDPNTALSEYYVGFPNKEALDIWRNSRYDVIEEAPWRADEIARWLKKKYGTDHNTDVIAEKLISRWENRNPRPVNLKYQAGHVRSSYQSFENPKTIDMGGKDYSALQATGGTGRFIKEAFDQGHDAVIFENYIDGDTGKPARVVATKNPNTSEISVQHMPLKGKTRAGAAMSLPDQPMTRATTEPRSVSVEADPFANLLDDLPSFGGANKPYVEPAYSGFDRSVSEPLPVRKNLAAQALDALFGPGSNRSQSGQAGFGSSNRMRGGRRFGRRRERGMARISVDDFYRRTQPQTPVAGREGPSGASGSPGRPGTPPTPPGPPGGPPESPAGAPGGSGGGAPRKMVGGRPAENLTTGEKMARAAQFATGRSIDNLSEYHQGLRKDTQTAVERSHRAVNTALVNIQEMTSGIPKSELESLTPAILEGREQGTPAQARFRDAWDQFQELKRQEMTRSGVRVNDNGTVREIYPSKNWVPQEFKPEILDKLRAGDPQLTTEFAAELQKQGIIGSYAQKIRDYYTQDRGIRSYDAWSEQPRDFIIPDKWREQNVMKTIKKNIESSLRNAVEHEVFGYRDPVTGEARNVNPRTGAQGKLGQYLAEIERTLGPESADEAMRLTRELLGRSSSGIEASMGNKIASTVNAINAGRLYGLNPKTVVQQLSSVVPVYSVVGEVGMARVFSKIAADFEAQNRAAKTSGAARVGPHGMEVLGIADDGSPVTKLHSVVEKSMYGTTKADHFTRIVGSTAAEIFAEQTRSRLNSNNPRQVRIAEKYLEAMDYTPDEYATFKQELSPLDMDVLRQRFVRNTVGESSAMTRTSPSRHWALKMIYSGKNFNIEQARNTWRMAGKQAVQAGNYAPAARLLVGGVLAGYGITKMTNFFQGESRLRPEDTTGKAVATYLRAASTGGVVGDAAYAATQGSRGVETFVEQMSDSQVEGLAARIGVLLVQEVNPPEVEKMVEGLKIAKPKDRMEILTDFFRRVSPSIRNWEGFFDRLGGEPVGRDETSKEKRKVDLLLK